MKVFYRPEQNASNAGHFAPSASKPKKFVEDLLARGLLGASEVTGFEPVTRADLKRAHDASHVDDVLDLQANNGFNNRDAEVAASLPYTSGSLLAAARHALAHNTTACSPTSGFHHAHYDHGYGFCTFNGLMVTALALLASGEARTIGIIDCDMHYGDGTDDIIRRLGVRGVIHHTQGQHFHRRADIGDKAEAFMGWLQQALHDCKDADLVIYQAGADPHINDPLGGLMTSAEMGQRDHVVFKALQNRPLVWNLAGGYQRDASGGIEPVLKLHRNTVQIFKESLNGRYT